MVENRPFGNILPHLILWIGIAIVAFPVYLAFVGSTHEANVIANGQMPLTPSGVIGDARRANADKGKKLLAVCAEGLANVLKNAKVWD